MSTLAYGVNDEGPGGALTGPPSNRYDHVYLDRVFERAVLQAYPFLDGYRILFTPGATFALHIALADCAGARVAVLAPYYPGYAPALRRLGARLHPVPLIGPQGLDPGAPDALVSLEGVTRLVNIPLNPVGAPRLSRGAYEETLLALGGDAVFDITNLGLLNDVPAGLEFGRPRYVVGSFSKLAAMAGERSGFIAVRDSADARRAAETLRAVLFQTARYAKQETAIRLTFHRRRIMAETRRRNRRNWALLRSGGGEVLTCLNTDGAYALVAPSSDRARPAATHVLRNLGLPELNACGLDREGWRVNMLADPKKIAAMIAAISGQF
jgi:aspartate/methionine/tyrosine aminotransferase